VTSDVEALNELFTAGVVAGLGDVFTLLAISVMMIVVDWRLALAAFAVIPFVYLTSRFFQERVREAYREIRTRLARINAFLQERLVGMRVVQLFGRERAEVDRFDRLNARHLESHLRSIRVYALYFPAIEVLTSIALASLIVGSASRVAETTLTVGTVAAFLQLVRRFFQPLQDLSEKFNILQGAMAASERIFRLLDTPAGAELRSAPVTGTTGEAHAAVAGNASGGPGHRRAEVGESAPRARDAVAVAEVRLPSGAARREPAHGSGRDTASDGHVDGPVAPPSVTVEFQDVWFAYAAPGAEPAAEPAWVLRGVSFVAAPGSTVALVGHTGAGKSTVVNLLMRFYEPQRGRITVNGTDVRDIPVDTLRALIGYVQQDIFLFAGDVATNIRLSNPLSDREVEAAAARVGADRVVRRLPGAYRHRLGERGASISVGERQLLSFARAIAAEPAVLLLDEATSAVDSEVEAEIQRALEVLMRGRTTIAVAHRLSTIVSADEILVMHHGQVVERGTHRALVARGGLYERLYRLQVGELTATAAGGPLA
jgi:ATP-binding cassette subfamily B protein